MNGNPRADKKFGQHFLINDGVISKIAEEVLRLSKNSGPAVIEIGPGPGALTRALLRRGLKVWALEIDTRMQAHLAETFADEVAAKNLIIVGGDALETDLNALLAQWPQPKVTVCGNLPYNVGSALLFRFLEASPRFEAFCFMLQKEVVKKLISSNEDDDYGVPSIKMRLFTDLCDHFWVKPGSFQPPPKVDSGVLSFRRSAQAPLSMFDEQARYRSFFATLDKAFQRRRKMLKSVFPKLKELPEGMLRPENVSPQRFWELFAASLLE